MSGLFDWRGIDKNGLARTGRIDARSALPMVKDRYEPGWRSLSVWVYNNPDRTVGEIAIELDSGRRTWWAEE
jgi:hypothetical protein